MFLSPLLPTLATSLALAAGSPEPSAMEYIGIRSVALDREVRVGVYLPPAYSGSERPYPVLYFLHGLFGSERKWQDRGVPEQLDRLIDAGTVPPMIVVCPDGQQSRRVNCMYVNWINGKAPWEDFISRELVAAIDAKYRTIPARRGRAISGDSMGGYGSLHIAFHHPDVFSAVSAHSAALFPVDPEQLPEWIKSQAATWEEIFGSPVDRDFWERNNPLHLAATVDAAELRSLAIYFDCGTDDRFGFDVGNTELSAILEERDIPHEFHLRSGGHGHEYFTHYVAESLQFHGKQFMSAANTPEAEDPEPEEAHH